MSALYTPRVQHVAAINDLLSDMHLQQLPTVF